MAQSFDRSFDVCIRGAGIVGRTLALLLARERLSVALVDSAGSRASSHSDVRAYAMNVASREVLQSVRCWPEAEHATPVLQMQVHGDQGGSVTFDAGRQHAEAMAWIVDVPALEQRLADATRFQSLVEVVSAPVSAPLTVVCEGRASKSRSEFGVEFDTTAYGQTAIATRLRSERPHSQIARQWFTPDGSILAFLPLEGPEGNSVAVVWSIPQEQVTQWLAADDVAFAKKLQALSENSLGTLELAAARASWPLQQAQARRWCGTMPQADRESTNAPHWVLAGDAAHTVHPLAGQGLNIGLADASALARILSERPTWRSVGDMRLLRQYERERKSALLPLGTTMDALQQLFARQESPLQALRNWGMRRFEMSGPVKEWVARQAMGLQPPAKR
ncbi:FAD-dependent monooxygenase [Diaphorobacter aerolatus]|uniref:FAD-dependent monooxygenase n=1 Tax=Diaphorobacter aerolatus TaxID=1288495 RepID=A0A7H0GHK5_9BURK|nr:FAD-dependent monooxygenase [Diaphorobacter aerolatus]QNP47771.1 FAD-dependent monooxygenase [Diaphorobacter aerolatus]